MKKLVATALLSSALFTLGGITTQANAICNCENQQNKGYVSVSYTAEKEVAPDTAEVSIAVRTDDKKSMQEAVRKNKEISDKVYAYLKTAIKSENGDYIKTSNYSASPSYIYNNGKRSLDKYNVSNNIIVHTKDIDNISKLIDKSLELGATNVDSLNFSLSEKDAQCAELLSEATAKARQRANIVAEAAGTSIVGVKSLDTSCSVNRSGRMPIYRNSLMAKGATMDAAAPETSTAIEAGVIKVYSSVNAVFYLK